MARTIAPITVLSEAAALLSEEGENHEYDRAIAELTCTLLGVSTDHKSLALTVLRLIKQ